MAPQLAGEIISALACDKGSGVKNMTASVASYPALTFFLKKVRWVYSSARSSLKMSK